MIDDLIGRLERGASVECTREMIDATRNGLFGGPCDEHVVYLPGFARYNLDGITMTSEEVAIARDWFLSREKVNGQS